jgi:peptide/nickel transport system permease protein
VSLHTDTEVVDQVPGTAEPERAEIQGRSLAQIAWGRLRRDRVAMVSLTVIIVVLLLAIFAPLVTRLLGLDPYQYNPDLVSDAGSLPGGWLNSGISWDHPLGVEPGTGRDILARLLYGARISLAVALTATVIAVVLGVLVGIVSGYSRGWVDGLLGRFMDLILSFPQLLILLALSPVLIQRLASIGITGNVGRALYVTLVLSVFGWPYLARIVRGQVLSLREREFVESAVSLGAGTPRILLREILPNLWAPVLVYTSLLIPNFIAAEATVSFFGIGVSEPETSWGRMLADSVTYFTVDPLYLFIPGTLLVIVVLAFNLLGDAVRDALDPRASRQ